LISDCFNEAPYISFSLDITAVISSHVYVHTAHSDDVHVGSFT